MHDDDGDKASEAWLRRMADMEDEHGPVIVGGLTIERRITPTHEWLAGPWLWGATRDQVVREWRTAEGEYGWTESRDRTTGERWVSGPHAPPPEESFNPKPERTGPVLQAAVDARERLEEELRSTRIFAALCLKRLGGTVEVGPAEWEALGHGTITRTDAPDQMTMRFTYQPAREHEPDA